jgi:hypothetical protein
MGFESPGATCCPNVNVILVYQKTPSESYVLSQHANNKRDANGYTITGCDDDDDDYLRGVNLHSQAPNQLLPKLPRCHQGPEHHTKQLFQLAYRDGITFLKHMQHQNEDAFLKVKIKKVKLPL